MNYTASSPLIMYSALARTQGLYLERMGLHRWELYYKQKMDFCLLELELTTPNPNRQS